MLNVTFTSYLICVGSGGMVGSLIFVMLVMCLLSAGIVTGSHPTHFMGVILNSMVTVFSTLCAAMIAWVHTPVRSDINMSIQAISAMMVWVNSPDRSDINMSIQAISAMMGWVNSPVRPARYC